MWVFLLSPHLCAAHICFGSPSLEDSFSHQNKQLEPVVWITNVSLNPVIYHLEPPLITRPASRNGLFPRCQFTSALCMLTHWKSSLGHVRSQGLPRRRCQALQSDRLVRYGRWGGGDDGPAALNGTEGMIDGCSSQPSSMHDPSVSHRL